MMIDGILFSASSPDRTHLLLEDMMACGWTELSRLDLNRNDVEAAMAAGVAGYVVSGLEPGRLRNVVQTAISRFREMERLRRERDEAVSAFDAVWCPVGR